MNQVITQIKYGDLEINGTEKDMIQIWGELKGNDPQVIFIEREKVDELINALEAQKTKA